MKEHTNVYIKKYLFINLFSVIKIQYTEEIKRRGGDLNSCGADAPRAFQARAVPV